MNKYLIILFLTTLSSCSSMFFKDLPKKNLTQERISKAKGFAEELLRKCEDKDYTEIQGYNIDASANRGYYTPEKLLENCKKSEEKYGKITVGDFHSAITPNQPKDFYDFFVYNVKVEKVDSLKYMVIALYRDKDYIKGTGLLTKPRPTIRINFK